jgi:hypothetical protein
MLSFAPPPKHKYAKAGTKLDDTTVEPTKKVSKREKGKEEMKKANHNPKKYWKESSSTKNVAIVGGALVVIGFEAIGAVGHMGNAASTVGHMRRASEGVSAAYVILLFSYILTQC